MSYVIKAHGASDIDKLTAYSIVKESEVILKDREVRSDKPDVHHHLLPATQTVSTTDETLPFSLSPSYLSASVTSLSATGSVSPSSDELSKLLNSFHFQSLESTATAYDLGSMHFYTIYICGVH